MYILLIPNTVRSAGKVSISEKSKHDESSVVGSARGSMAGSEVEAEASSLDGPSSPHSHSSTQSPTEAVLSYQNEGFQQTSPTHSMASEALSGEGKGLGSDVSAAFTHSYKCRSVVDLQVYNTVLTINFSYLLGLQ